MKVRVHYRYRLIQSRLVASELYCLNILLSTTRSVRNCLSLDDGTEEELFGRRDLRGPPQVGATTAEPRFSRHHLHYNFEERVSAQLCRTAFASISSSSSSKAAAAAARVPSPPPFPEETLAAAEVVVTHVQPVPRPPQRPKTVLAGVTVARSLLAVAYALPHPAPADEEAAAKALARLSLI